MPVAECKSGVESRHAERVVGRELMDLYEKVLESARLTYDDAVRLYQTPNLSGVGYLANLVRERMHGERAYYIRNQHINYTNVCNKHCRFCYRSEEHTSELQSRGLI